MTQQDELPIKNFLFNLIDLLNWPYSKNDFELFIYSIMSILAVNYKMFNLLLNVCEEKCDFVSNKKKHFLYF